MKYFVALASTCLVLFLMVASMLHHRGFLFEDDDPLGYYVYAHSAVQDHDLDLRNQYEYFRSKGSSLNFSFNRLNPRTGRADNQYTVGFPLLTIPVLLVARPWYPNNGRLDDFPWFADQLIFSLTSLLIGILGMWLTWRFVSFYYPKEESLLATLLFWIGSPVLYYLVREPFLSHLASIFAVSLLLYFWKVPFKNENLRFLCLGLTAALLTMVRQQDVVAVAIPLGSLLLERPPARTWIHRLSAFIGGFVAIFWIQMAVWHYLRGTYLAYSYTGFPFLYLTNPRILSTLFSSNHGLLSWHPIIVLCLIGVCLLRDKRLAVLLMLYFLAELYIVSSWWNWWKGFSFGNRAFLGLTPVFVLGLASLLRQVQQRRLLLSICVCFCVWNLILMLAYLSDMVPHQGGFSWIDLLMHLPELPARVLGKIHGL